MNQVNFKTGRIIGLSDSIQSLTLDLEGAIGDENRKQSFALVDAINSLAESINKEAGEIDSVHMQQERGQDTDRNTSSPANVLNFADNSQEEPGLNPAWYQHALESDSGEVTDLSLTDSLDCFFRDMGAISTLLMHSGRDEETPVEGEIISQIGALLSDKMQEGQHLVEHWHRSKQKRSA